MQLKRGIVFTGGSAPTGEIAIQRRERSVIVAADSGLDTADRLGVVPDAIVGDMDSLQDRSLLERYADADIQRYRTAKDWTDTEIGIQYLWKIGIFEVTIVGGGGGRIDHLLGISSLFHRQRYPRRWITDREDIRVIDSHIEFDAPKDRVVSFFPVGPERCTMESVGLRWELTGLVWKQGDVGISNECREKTCRVEMHSGRLMMVHALQSPLVL